MDYMALVNFGEFWPGKHFRFLGSWVIFIIHFCKCVTVHKNLRQRNDNVRMFFVQSNYFVGTNCCVTALIDGLVRKCASCFSVFFFFFTRTSLFNTLVVFFCKSIYNKIFPKNCPCGFVSMNDEEISLHLDGDYILTALTFKQWYLAKIDSVIWL